MVEFFIESVLIGMFLDASGFIDWFFPWRHPPPLYPLLEKEWAVKTAKQVMQRAELPGKSNGAVTLWLLGWIEADDMEKMLTARIAYPDRIMEPVMVGVYPSYNLVNQGHKALVAPDD